ncbi:MAG TPA: SAM-dependent methyltransferase [Oleiagrimonas sp.]|nr:SAM-dependent methyltransferase [Oleiagrimonas sp.]
MTNRLPEPAADARAHSDRLSALLRKEIAAQGPIPFARYMERCLYAPSLGYYSAGSAKLGAEGDFVTAPELGSLFARCVVSNLLPALRAMGDDADIIELGAGSGAFAESALNALADADSLPRHYRILEPSADLRERQRERLQAALPQDIAARVEWLDRPPDNPWRGVLFANEVIDALPTTRFTKRDGEVFEEHVDLDAGGNLAIVDRPADPLVAAAVRHVEQTTGAPLADGYRSEILPQLPYWLQAVAGRQEAGLLLFIDYGYIRRDYYRADRDDGTLRAHYRHRAHNDPFFCPGLQDLTAHVDFTALAEAGVNAGYDMAAYVPQAQFLIAGDIQQAFADAHATATDEAERYALAQQVKQLTLPGMMGERFQAMLFKRGLNDDVISGALRQFDRGARL